jgi:hypothetical protein
MAKKWIKISKQPAPEVVKPKKKEIEKPEVVKPAYPKKEISGRSIEIMPVSMINNNSAVVTNGLDQEIRDFQVVLSYHTLMGIPVSQRVNEFYESGDERLVGRSFLPNLLLPGQRLRFRLLRKRNAHGGDCTVRVSGKTIDGKVVSDEEKILLIM